MTIIMETRYSCDGPNCFNVSPRIEDTEFPNWIHLQIFPDSSRYSKPGDFCSQRCLENWAKKEKEKMGESGWQ